jgi:hypothetical protein
LTVTIRPSSSQLCAIPQRRAVSYLPDGRQVVWEPQDAGPDPIAVDAELLSRPVPRELAARYAPASRLSFYVAWTQAECAAKLNAVPILTWLRRHGLTGDPQLATETTIHGDVVVTTARSRSQNIA